MELKTTAAVVSALAIASGAACAQEKAPASRPAPARAAPVLKPCQSTTVDPPTYLTLGKSQVIKLDFPAARMVVGGAGASSVGRPAPVPSAATPGAPGAAPRPPAAIGPSSDGVADTEITLLSPTELFFLGRRTGSMNVVLQGADGRCVVKDLIVAIDPSTLQGTLNQLIPDETGVRVRAAENSVVLTGVVSDATKLEQVLGIAGSYAEGKKIVNLLRVGAPQQVMLEVKIAEVSKTLLDHLGLNFARMVTSSDTASVISGIIGGGPAFLARFATQVATGVGASATTAAAAGSGVGSAFIGGLDRTQTRLPDGTFVDRLSISSPTIAKNATLATIDAQKKDGIVRILAEPNIMAISGQSASFLSGGKIFIPVSQNNANNTGGGSTITLEEKEFGVGLKFTPTVLDGSRINLKLLSEVSDLSQTGSPFTAANGTVAILPSMTTRRVDTTVQLQDGQSFVVAGLIKNNLSQALDKFPGLGDAPVLGALFRSTEFQTDQSELMFLITPRLVKPLTGPVTVPTDNHIVPTQGEVYLSGQTEGKVQLPPAP